MSDSKTTPTITLYHLPPISRAVRTACLLEEMNLPYRVVSGERQAHRASEAYTQQAGGLGRAPTLHDEIVHEDGTTEKIIVHESGAIFEYLLAQYPRPELNPSTPLKDRLQISQYLHMAESTFLFHSWPVLQSSMLLLPIVQANLGDSPEAKEQTSSIVSQMNARFWLKVDHDLNWLEAQLEEQKKMATAANDGGKLFLVGGRFTVADVMMGWSIDLILQHGMSEEERKGIKWKNIVQWLDQLKERPSWKQATEKLKLQK